MNTKVVGNKNNILSGTSFKILVLLSLIFIIFENWCVYNFGKGEIFCYILTGTFIFDTVLTLIFIAKLTNSFSKNSALLYFMRSTGWIEFISTVFPLILSSLPCFIFAYFNGRIDVTAALFFVPVINIVSNLRLLRFVPLFHSNENDDHSTMKTKHLLRINSIFASIFVFSITILPLLSSISGIRTPYDKYNECNKKSFAQIEGSISDNYNEEKLINTDAAFIKKEGKFVYVNKKMDTKVIKRDLLFEKIVQMGKNDKTVVYFFNDDFFKESSVTNINNFIIMLLIISGISIIYSRYLVKYIINPLVVMSKQFQNYDYILSTKIPANCENDEIYILSALINERWLPAKLKKINENGLNRKSLLQIDNVFKGQD